MPDLDSLWDFANPAETEKRFRELLPEAEQSGDTSNYLQLLTQIARTQGLQRQFTAAHKTLDQVEPQATIYPVVEIRYLLERGRTYRSAGQPQKALPLFQQAYDRAIAAKEDFYAIDAAHMIAITVPTDEQMAWNLKALTLAEQSPDPKAQRWRGSLYNNMGWTYHDAGQFDQALDLFQKALKFREEQGKSEDIRIAKYMVARALRSLNRIDEALVILREIEHGEADGFIEEELAECLLLKGEVEAARPYFAAAYVHLSQDQWLVRQEPLRLTRLNTLSK